MTFHHYRSELPQKESAIIRSLRRRGFAVVLFGPRLVGDPMTRGEIEGAMIRAGKALLEEKRRVTR